MVADRRRLRCVDGVGIAHRLERTRNCVDGCPELNSLQFDSKAQEALLTYKANYTNRLERIIKKAVATGEINTADLPRQLKQRANQEPVNLQVNVTSPEVDQRKKEI